MDKVLARLENIERSLSHFQDTLQKVLIASSDLGQHVFAEQPYLPNISNDDHQLGEYSPVSGHFIGEHYYGSSSAYALMLEAQQLAHGSAGAAKPQRIDDFKDDVDIPKQTATPHLDTISSRVSNNPLNFSSDNLPLALPPRGLAEACIEPYFSQVQYVLPIFSKDSFWRNAQVTYTGESRKPDRAWIICFNNLILQTMSLRASTLNQDGTIDVGNSLAMEMLHPFLVNWRRSLSNAGT